MGNIMSDKELGKFSRREVLSGSVAALTMLMLDASIVGQALAQDATLRSDPRYAFVDRLAELVIPETDSPGASAAGTAGFVLLALDRRMSDLEPEMLDRVHTAVNNAANGDFMRLPQNRQTLVVAAYDREAFSGEAAVGSSGHAWRRVKAAIVAGYYTSEIGATRELVYDHTPGEFENIRVGPDYRDRSNNGFGGQI
jgi:hypothetical protein